MHSVIYIVRVSAAILADGIQQQQKYIAIGHCPTMIVLCYEHVL